MKTVGIIGYGYVGKAVEYGFNKCNCLISDPKYNDISIEQILGFNPEVIFLCLPSPTDDTKYSLITNTIEKIKSHNYSGLLVVKSTILPHYIQNYDIIYNPEFLSHKTSLEDFVNPPMVLIGGNRSQELVDFYKKNSIVNTEHYIQTDVKTASLVKYTFNTFYATKVTFMNEIYKVSKKLNVDYKELTDILSLNPWIGKNHLKVPGPDGKYGFGGDCLPKDTEAFVREFNIDLLKEVLRVNKENRK